MNLINELRMLAEDLHVNGYSRYSAAMSKAADELAKWEAVFGPLGGTPDECGNAIIAARDEPLNRLEADESDALEQARLNGVGASREAALMAKLEAAEKERDELRAELETERMRLAACGVVAFANTPDSAKQAREMRPEYWSASCGDVARMVDENIKLRAKIETMEKQEPVAEIGQQYTLLFVGSGSMTELVKRHGIKVGDKLYALPGAQGE